MIYEDILLAGLVIIVSVLLFFLTDKMEIMPHVMWKVIFAVPFVICLFAIGFADFEISMTGVYAASFLVLFGFVNESVKLRKTVCGIAVLMAAVSFGICNINPGYRSVDYVKGFEDTFAEMQEKYVLGEYKEIDYDALYEEYHPKFEEANKKHDAALNAKYMKEFAREFHDAHVYYMAETDAISMEADCLIYGNDYGMSLIRLEDGSVVAVNVDESVKALGINNGTVITGWDGRDVNEVIDNCETEVYEFARKDNKEFYQPIAAAGTGGETNEVTFLDDNGNGHTVTLNSLGYYSERCKETVGIIDKGIPISSLEFQDINEDTTALRISMMLYDNESMHSEDYSAVKEAIEEKLTEKKEAGIKNIIIDLRANGGGSGKFVEVFTEIFAPSGEHIYAYDGMYDKSTHEYVKNEDGTFKVEGCETYVSTGLGSDMNIIILVNAATASAGDHMTYLLHEFPNVTVMGLTHSSSSSQGVGDIKCVEGSLSYSKIPILHEDGTIIIDSDASMESEIPLDVRVPMTKEAVEMMFTDGEDYVLQYATKYLEVIE